jgi:hypothetical protein
MFEGVFGIVARGNRMLFVDIFGNGWRPPREGEI